MHYEGNFYAQKVKKLKVRKKVSGIFDKVQCYVTSFKKGW